MAQASFLYRRLYCMRVACFAKVSRDSRWQAPEDYVKDKEHVMKSATFGMHFYH